MGTKNNPGHFDCIAKAKDDEPMFTLLGRDQSGGLLVRLWALLRHRRVELGARPPEEAAKIAEALKCADAMDAYCRSVARDPLKDDFLLMVATNGMREHPEGYEGACACNLCLSYACEGAAIHAPGAPRPIPGVSPQPNSFEVNDEGGGP